MGGRRDPAPGRARKEPSHRSLPGSAPSPVGSPTAEATPQTVRRPGAPCRATRVLPDSALRLDAVSEGLEGAPQAPKPSKPCRANSCH